MMVAKLVTVSLMVRVVVDADAPDEKVWLAAKSKLIDSIDDGGMDNLEAIEDDIECPFDPLNDCL